MTTPQEEEINQHFESIKKALLQNRHITYGVHVDIATLFLLIAQIQLALRHPANTGAAADETRALTIRLIDLIRKDQPEAAAVLDMGWEPSLDIAP